MIQIGAGICKHCPSFQIHLKRQGICMPMGGNTAKSQRPMVNTDQRFSVPAPENAYTALRVADTPHRMIAGLAGQFFHIVRRYDTQKCLICHSIHIPLRQHHTHQFQYISIVIPVCSLQIQYFPLIIIPKLHSLAIIPLAIRQIPAHPCQ